MTSIRRALLFFFATGYTAVAIQFFATLILARLLTPAQIGVFSIAAVIIAVGHMLRDFGVGPYIIQTKELDQAHLRSSFALSILIAWTIGTIFMLASGPVGRFYDNDTITRIMMVLAANFFILPVGTVTRAYWRRHLQFRPIYIVSTAASLVRAATAVGLAALEFGAMSLAWAALAGTLCNGALSALMRPKELPWRPGLRHIREVFSFSSWVTGTSTISEVAAGAPDMIIGKLIGAEAVGFFGKALGTIQIFGALVMRGIYPVLLPHLAARYHSAGNLKKEFLRASGLLTVLAWPFFGFLMIFAEPVIRLLYGPQWDASVPVLRILTLYGFFYGLVAIYPQVLVALGAVRKALVLALMVEPIKVLLLLFLVPLGLGAAATAVVMGSLIQFLLQGRVLLPLIGLRHGDLLAAVTRSAGVTGLALAGPVLVALGQEAAGYGDYAALLLATLLLFAGWFAAIWWTSHPIRDEIADIVLRVRAGMNTTGGNG